ncbi:MAG: hypothetical protein HY562_00915 [Ignavibacteriales bacterium]|nr:hypothetical protein [Ignavibacteriales bacterium]
MQQIRAIAVVFLFCSCVEKLDLTQFPEIPATVQQRVEYIPLLPEWGGFNDPSDVHVGYDELVYVADTQNDRIVQLDINGNILGFSQTIRDPVAIAQDRKLDLLVVGRYDTLLSGNQIQLAAVFRLNLITVQHDIARATPIPVVVHPRYVLGKTGRTSDSSVHFTGISTLADNQYYVTRVGPENASLTQPGGPDNNVIHFSATDVLITPLTAYLNATGTGKASANQISAIASYAVPPQRAEVDRRKSFIVTLLGDNSFRVQGMNYYETADGVGYELEPAFESIDTTVSSRFLYDCTPGDGILGSCFKQPQDVTYSADSRFIFVVDAGTDSLYQFASNGFEGVRPPALSNQKKNIIVSFGGRGSGPTQFNHPKGVAYFQTNRILLVADAGNNRIVRFKLSTDFQ